MPEVVALEPGKPLKIAALTKYTRIGPSSRYRFLSYFEAIRAAGHRVDHYPLFDARYLEARFASRIGPLAGGLRYFPRRIATLPRLFFYDVLWIEGELFPRFPGLFEFIFSRIGKRIVLDYDDALFHIYDTHPSRMFRVLLGNKIDGLMRRADAVIAGNDYIAERARHTGAKTVEVVPTTVNSSKYSRRAEGNATTFTIGWIGSPSTAKYLLRFKNALRRFLDANDARLVLIGAAGTILQGPKIEYVKWSEEAEATAISQFDVGIAPQDNGLWEQGKCGLKVLQYMAASVPAIVSRSGALPQIVAEGNCGFIVDDDAGLLHALESLQRDRALRQRLGDAGRRLVEERYDLALYTNRLIALLSGRHAETSAAAMMPLPSGGQWIKTVK